MVRDYVRWWNRAACRGLPSEWFEPCPPLNVRSRYANRRPKLNHHDRAVKICASCPVALECWVTGIIENAADGSYGFDWNDIRGGATAKQRRSVYTNLLTNGVELLDAE